MNQVAVREKSEVSVDRDATFTQFLASKKSDVEAILPAHVTFEKFQRVVLTAVGMNKELLSDGKSLFQSCLQCAADGLMPDGREAAFVIFNTNERFKNENGVWCDNWIKKVQYMPMIKGLIKLARNSGDITNFTAQVVHENDKFTFDMASEERPKHEIDLNKPRGKLLAAYAIANFKDGSFQLEVMTRDEIERIKRCSKGVKKDKKTGEESGIWISWESEMWRKTVAKRLMKYLSLSPEVNRAIDADNAFYDLEKLNAPQKQTALPTNLSADWNTKDPEPELEAAEFSIDHDNELEVELEEYGVADLSNDIAEAIFPSEVVPHLTKFVATNAWRQMDAQGQVKILSDIVAPKMLEVGLAPYPIDPDGVEALANLFALDQEHLSEFVAGKIPHQTAPSSADMIALSLIRQSQLAQNG